MDTSDSECFESADESFHSDEEDTTTVIASKVKNLKIGESEKSVEQRPDAENFNCDNKREDIKPESKRCFDKKEVDAKSLHQKESEAVQPDKKGAEVQNLKSVSVKDEVGTAQKEENLWNDDGDWGSLNEAESNKFTPDHKSTKVENSETVGVKSKLEEEENLWDDDEDWGNLSKAESNEPNTTLQKEENLWDNDDDWGNFSNTNKHLPPSVNDPALYDNTQLPPNLKKGKLVSKYVPEEDKWEVDAWESLNDEKTQSDDSKQSWGGWGNWGVTSILSTATQGVSTLTSQVSQGLSTVLESGMGVPDPEEMARINRLEQQHLNDNAVSAENNNPSLGFGLGNLVSGVSQITKIAGVSQITKMVESTSTKVISSGLDTLETIGKKTMEVLQEGDPGLKRKRAFLQINQEKPVLSQLLREAKEKADAENKILEQKHFAKKANYESIFDDHQGLVHLEALEMLSKQCDIKLQTILETYSGDTLKEVQETMEQVKELCEIPDEEEEEVLTTQEARNRLENAVSEIGIPITYDKLAANWEETEEWLNKLNLSVCSERELHQQAIETLAQLTAMAVEQFHKSGELLLVKEHRSTADEADSLVQ